MDIPNLDAMHPEELRDTARVLDTLGDYAKQKSCAMEAREDGRIEAARAFERSCDDLYEQLPDEWRW